MISYFDAWALSRTKCAGRPVHRRLGIPDTTEPLHRQVPRMMVAWTEESESKDEQGQPMVRARLQSYQGPLRYERMLDFLRLLNTMVADKRAGCAASTRIVVRADRKDVLLHLVLHTHDAVFRLAAAMKTHS